MVGTMATEKFVGADDLSVIEPDQLAELSGLSLEDCAPIVEYAEKEAERLEKETAAQKAEGRRLAHAERSSRRGCAVDPCRS